MVTTKDIIDKTAEILSKKDKLEGEELSAVKSSINTVKELAEAEAKEKVAKTAKEIEEEEKKKKEAEKAAGEKMSGKLDDTAKELAEKTEALKELSEKEAKATKELSEIKEAEKAIKLKELAEKEILAGILTKEKVAERTEELKGFDDEVIEQLTAYVSSVSPKEKAIRKSFQTDNLKDDKGDSDKGLLDVQLDGSTVSIKNPSDW